MRIVYMTRFQYLLIKLAEESSEVAKQALKTSQFGYDSYNPNDYAQTTNHTLLSNELTDLMVIVYMLKTEYDFDFGFVDINIDKYEHILKQRIDKINTYFQYSTHMGYI